MKIAVLGTGQVGRAIADKLVSLDHETWMGSRTADNPAAAEWVVQAGKLGHHGTLGHADFNIKVVRKG